MTKKLDIEFPRDFYLDDVGVWRLNKEKIIELERSNVQTNEEYLKSLDTEQFAKWMVRLQIVGIHSDKHSAVDIEMFIADTVEWLKQPHEVAE